MKSTDATIDELYQLPLEQFTDARNAKAKELKGADKLRLKSLAKPSQPLWAVNQLYWKDRATYNALVDASERLRAAHRTLLGGRRTDIDKPESVHRHALDRAVAKTFALLRNADPNASDATLEAVRRTLAALPTDEPPGRMLKQPGPAGFSLLAGVKVRPMKEEPAPEAEPEPEPEPPTPPPPPPPKPVKPQPSAKEMQRFKAAEKELDQDRAALERARFRLATAEQDVERLREKLKTTE